MQPFQNHFSGRASNYLTHRPSYPLDLVEWLVELPEEHSLAWDAGCGSGQLSIPLARRFEEVIASDASAHQISAAPPHPRVRYRVARAEGSGLPPGVVDLAVAAQSAHWFSLEDYFAEVRRVAKRDASMALVCYGRPELRGNANDVLRRFHQDVLAPFWPPERRFVDELYRSLPFPFEEVPVPELTMTHSWGLARFCGYVETWSAVRNLEERAGPAPLQEFFGALEESWGEPDDLHEVRWPLGLRASRQVHS